MLFSKIVNELKSGSQSKDNAARQHGVIVHTAQWRSSK
jgi:hypothetical protein